MSKAARNRAMRAAASEPDPKRRVCITGADLYWKTRAVIGDVDRLAAQLKAQEAIVQQTVQVRNALLREVSLANGDAVDPATIANLAYDDATLTITLTLI